VKRILASLCIFTIFHFPDSGLFLLTGFDFDFDLFWIAWHWKPAIYTFDDVDEIYLLDEIYDLDEIYVLDAIYPWNEIYPLHEIYDLDEIYLLKKIAT